MRRMRSKCNSQEDREIKGRICRDAKINPGPFPWHLRFTGWFCVMLLLPVKQRKWAEIGPETIGEGGGGQGAQTWVKLGIFHAEFGSLEEWSDPSTLWNFLLVRNNFKVILGWSSWVSLAYCRSDSKAVFLTLQNLFSPPWCKAD